MARHVISAGRLGGRRLVIVVAALVVAVAAAGTIAAANPRGLIARAPIVGDDCPSTRLPATTLSVTLAPEIAPTVQKILQPLTQRKLPDGNCLTLAYSNQAPAETIAGSEILPADRAPHVWIPDSSLWLMRSQNWKTEKVASFASSPVVLATSKETVSAAKWDETPPSWQEAMKGDREVAAPEIAQDAAGLSAVIALWQSLGKGPTAEQGLAATVLASLRSEAPSREEALESATEGDDTAPLTPVSEHIVVEANKGRSTSRLVAVYPEDGSPSLDFPVLQVSSPTLTAERRAAIKVVADELASAQARVIVKRDGLRDATGASGDSPTEATGVSNGEVEPITTPEPAELVEVVKQVATLSAPSQMLIVFDVSGSMKGPAAGGLNRVQVASQSATIAGGLLPDIAKVGMWGFSRNYQGSKNRVEFLDVAELGEREGKVSHRDLINGRMARLEQDLGGDGTALYETAVAAMEKMNDLYDPRAGNAVVLFTDGANEDKGGPKLAETLRKLNALYKPEQPVRLICVGIGAGADLSVLKQMSEAAGGTAYAADDPRVLVKVLFEQLSTRPE